MGGGSVGQIPFPPPQCSLAANHQTLVLVRLTGTERSFPALQGDAHELPAEWHRVGVAAS